MQTKLKPECLYQGRPSRLGSKETKSERSGLLWNMPRLWSCLKYHTWKCLLSSSHVLSFSVLINCPQQQCDIFNTAGTQLPDICCHQFSCPLSTHCSCSVHPCHKSQTLLFLCSLLVKIYQFAWPDIQASSVPTVSTEGGGKIIRCEQWKPNCFLVKYTTAE